MQFMKVKEDDIDQIEKKLYYDIPLGEVTTDSLVLPGF